MGSGNSNQISRYELHISLENTLGKSVLWAIVVYKVALKLFIEVP